MFLVYIINLKFRVGQRQSHFPLSYLISLNPLHFKNIAYVGSFKHIVFVFKSTVDMGQRALQILKVEVWGRAFVSSCWFLLVQISGQKMKPEFKKVFHLFEEFGGGRRVCNRDHLSRSCQCSSLLPLPPTHPSFPLSKFWEKPGGFLCGKAGGPHLLESGWRPTSFSSLFSFSINIWRMAANKGRSGEVSQDDEQRRQVLSLWIQDLGSKPTRRSALWAPGVNVEPHWGVPFRGGGLVWRNLLLSVPWCLMQKPGRY